MSYPIGFRPTSVPEREHPEYDPPEHDSTCMGVGLHAYSARGWEEDREAEEELCETCDSRAKWEFRLACIRTGAAVVAVLAAVVAVANSL